MSAAKSADASRHRDRRLISVLGAMCAPCQIIVAIACREAPIFFAVNGIYTCSLSPGSNDVEQISLDNPLHSRIGNNKKVSLPVVIISFEPRRWIAGFGQWVSLNYRFAPVPVGQPGRVISPERT